MQQDFEKNNIEVETVVCATGSGGTQAGLSLGFALQNKKTTVLGMAVCDSKEYFLHKAQADIEDWYENLPLSEKSQKLKSSLGKVKINTIDQYIGPGYAVGYDDVFETISWLAKEEGVVLDPVYTGKAFYGLIEEIKSGKFIGCKNIVFIHTGGIYGLFPYKNNFANVC